MKVKCGIDLVYIPDLVRIKKSDGSLRKFFHAQEIEGATEEHLAGILAAKEAFYKCSGEIPHFLDLEIGHDKMGKPFVKNSPQSPTYSTIDISISHEKDYAVACCVMIL